MSTVSTEVQQFKASAYHSVEAKAYRDLVAKQSKRGDVFLNRASYVANVLGGGSAVAFAILTGASFVSTSLVAGHADLFLTLSAGSGIVFAGSGGVLLPRLLKENRTFENAESSQAEISTEFSEWVHSTYGLTVEDPNAGARIIQGSERAVIPLKSTEGWQINAELVRVEDGVYELRKPSGSATGEIEHLKPVESAKALTASKLPTTMTPLTAARS